MIDGSCHCGNVTFTTVEVPQWLTNCNCTICWRLGGLWAHVSIESVRVMAREPTVPYVREDANLAFHTCPVCGCTTHWENLKSGADAHMALNFRMCSPEELKGYRVRHFDGAQSWAYLD